MMHLIYTPLALEDFEKILDRIAEDNPAAAVRLGEDIPKTCELLKSHPMLGEQKDDLGDGLRRFSCRVAMASIIALKTTKRSTSVAFCIPKSTSFPSCSSSQLGLNSASGKPNTSRTTQDAPCGFDSSHS